MNLNRRVLVFSVVVLVSVFGATTHADAQTNDLQPLVDLLPGTDQPTDGASVLLKIVPVDDTQTAMSLAFEGLVGDAGRQLRADLHVGPCIPGDGDAAGAHFNTTGQPPETVDSTTEAWIDFTIPESGKGTVLVPLFFPLPVGEIQSLVIHERDAAQPNTTGQAWACQRVAALTDQQLIDRAEASLSLTLPDEVLGLAITGPSWTEVLAVVGGALVVAGAIATQTASVIGRRETD